MHGTRFPSGDPQADRRAEFAETLAHLGDAAGAIETLTGALQLAPGWAAGWLRLGEYLEATGDTEAAVTAYNRACAADPADPLGAGLRRDLLRDVPLADRLPPAFVELLFDQYAPRFDRALVDRLGYRGPEQLGQALDRAGIIRVDRALDLGCGTGLTGVVLRPRSGWLAGIDISAGMLSEAREKELYDRLDQADITALEIGESYDLIAAGDVFNYIGALERTIGWCAGSLTPGGTLVFNVEQGDGPVTLHEGRRFRHSRAYVAGLLDEAGFARVSCTECTLRHDRGAPVAALTVLASLPGSTVTYQGDGESEVPA
ncbi:methyltransferase [Mameliella alba]|uniref:class I SAM-dependent DNA methyltransferase n=1 Tax=Mameliella alba TaxID=561184 RepID=UPI0013E47AB4|nr:methyltransferase [Mameliella alba]BBU57294.1 methyltransferase [Mameliella alba]